MKFVVSKSEEGFKVAVTKVLRATWQRCHGHFGRDVLAQECKTQRRIVPA